MPIEAINPTTGEKIRSCRSMTKVEIDEALRQCEQAFLSWQRVSFSDRARKMQEAGRILKDRAPQYARLMAEEMGKPLAQGVKETEKCAWACEYYAGNSESFLSPMPVKTDASKSYVTFEPLGILLAIMPWNFPFWQVFRAAAPAVMAGNVVVLKHASNVPGCAEAIEKIFKEAGFPEGVFKNLWVETQDVVWLVERPLVKAVTLTGSVAAGKAVATKAGSALKKTVLELGGSDPYLILEDADIDQAANTCGESRLVNSGQSCIAAKRFIVVESVHDRFVKGLVDYMKVQRMGNPLDEGVTLGPMARIDLRDSIHKQVTESIAKGAKLVLGGQIPEGPGAFYPPTILTGVKKGMPAFDEEIFGPVAAVIRVKDEKEAIHAANDTLFGLGAAVFTGDVERGERIARRELKAGCAFVNASVKSDPRLPFGGVDQSGYGRELSLFGIREFVNIKTVYVK